jgi:hydrogenase maturation protease
MGPDELNEMGLPGRDAVRRVALIGVGNETRRDEGVALRVLREVERLGVPRGVTVRFEGTDGLALLNWSGAAEVLILVDAWLAPGVAAGTCERFGLDDVEDRHRMDSSTHELRPLQALELARALDLPMPRVVVYAVAIHDMAFGEALSPEVEAAVPSIAARVHDELWGLA